MINHSLGRMESRCRAILILHGLCWTGRQDGAVVVWVVGAHHRRHLETRHAFALLGLRVAARDP